MNNPIPGTDPLDPPAYGSVYRLRVDACMAAAKQALNRQFLLFAVLVPLVVVGMNASNVVTGKGSMDVAIISGAALLLFLALLLSGVYVLRSQKLRGEVETFASFQLAIGHNSVLRTHKDLPRLEILRAEITSIDEQPNNGLLIRTSDPLRTLLVPKLLDGYEEARDRLMKWRPSQEQAAPKSDALETVLGVVMLVSWFTTWTVMISPWGFIPSMLTIVLGFRAIYRLWKSPNTTPQQRKGGTILFGLMVSAPASVLTFMSLWKFLAP